MKGQRKNVVNFSQISFNKHSYSREINVNFSKLRYLFQKHLLYIFYSHLIRNISLKHLEKSVYYTFTDICEGQEKYCVIQHILALLVANPGSIPIIPYVPLLDQLVFILFGVFLFYLLLFGWKSILDWCLRPSVLLS